MKLLALKLNDFQAHKETLIEFSPTITTIKGPTDVGKSSVLRALRWICLNDIAGDEFIREGQKKTIINLQIQDQKKKRKIERIRSSGGSINTYELDGEEYKAFSTSVPSDISKLLNLNEINFQGQHDGPFWFNETAGEVSRRLNTVVDLTVIDLALSNVASEVRRAQEKKIFIEERLVEVKDELEKLKSQRARVDEFKSLKDIHDRFENLEARSVLLESFIGRIRSRRDHSKELEEKTSYGEELLSFAKEALGHSESLESLSELLIQIDDCQSKAKPPADFSGVEKVFDEWMDLEGQTKSMVDLVSDVSKAELSSRESVMSLEFIEKRFHQETKGKRCPLCRNVIL